MKGMRICIAGSRLYVPKWSDISEAVNWTEVEVQTVVTGGCRGVDETAWCWAEVQGHHRVEFPADWKRYGKKAGPLRNRQMADFSDLLLILGPTEGKGTRSVMEEFYIVGKPVYVWDAKSIVVGKPHET